MAETIAFRDLNGIRDLEDRTRDARDNRLMADELAQLARDLTAKSLELFGITIEDTRYDPTDENSYFSPDPKWEENFAFLDWEYDEEPQFWEAFGIDMTDEEGDILCCSADFGRQLICALRQLHPQGTLTFAPRALSQQQVEAAAEAWGKMLLAKGKR